MPFTRIQAVNRILRAGGGSPVNSLGTGSDASNLAEASLVDAIKSIQVEAQVFNTVRTTLIPNIDKKIPVDSSVIALDGRSAVSSDAKVSTSSTAGNGINVGAAGGSASAAIAQADITVRSGFVYDLANNTDEFSKSVLAWVTNEFRFEDCPSHVQEYAITIAAREYQMEHQGDPLAEARLASKEEQARQVYNRIEVQQADANHFTRATNTTLLAVGGRHRRHTPNSVIPGS